MKKGMKNFWLSLFPRLVIPRFIMIPSPWVYHALNLLSTKLGDAQFKQEHKMDIKK
jgi:hypothetical protein